MSTRGALISPDEYLALRNLVKSEISRRSTSASVGSMAQYSSGYNYGTQPTRSVLVLDEHIRKITQPVDAICGSNYTQGDHSYITADILNAASAKIYELSTKNPAGGGDTGCAASCSGLCYSGCYSACSGCTGSCTGSCNNTCTGSCTGSCANTCTGSCTGSCNTSCSGGCKGGCGTSCNMACSYGCSGGCYGCSGDCGSSCSGGCSGCGGDCTAQCSGTCGGNSCTGGCVWSCSNCGSLL